MTLFTPKARSLTALVLLLSASSLLAAEYKWDISPDPGLQSGSGTWDTTSTLWTTNNGTSNVSWVNGNEATFSGTDAPGGTFYDIKVTSSLSLGTLSVTRNGYRLNADTPTTLSLTKVSVANGYTATFGSNLTFSAGSSNSFQGAFELHGGITTEASVNLSFAQVRVTASSTARVASGSSFVLSGTFTSNGAAISTAGSNGHFVLGNGSSETASSRFILNSGTVSLNATTASAGNLRFGPNAGSGTNEVDLTVELNGGEFVAGRVLKGAIASYRANMVFNGGILKVMLGSTSGATYMEGLDKAIIRNGGLIFDTNGVATTVKQNLLHSDMEGDLAKDGGLTKRGTGTLILAGANTYTGDTRVEEGTLRLNGMTIDDLSSIYLSENTLLNLNYTGTDTIGSLYLDGIGQAIGTWGALGSAADFKTSFITGTGLLNVTAIPEPSTYLLLAGAAGGLSLLRRGRC